MSSKVFPIIEEVVQHELGLYREPTIPHLLWPQTPEAIERGCICPKELNEKRLRDGKSPILVAICRVHSKLCNAEPCVCQQSPANREGDHSGAHLRCDHCTNILHICQNCEAVYLEDGDDPSLGGWKLVTKPGSGVIEWRCTRCQ